MPELRLAVGLVGYYGLRECEIAVIYPSKCGGYLEIGSQCKENARQRLAYSGGRPPRKVHHLAVKGRPVNEAKDMLAQRHGGHRDREMGVVGHADHHRINLFFHLVKHHPEILEALRLWKFLEGFGASIEIHVTKRHDVLFRAFLNVTRAHTPNTDGRDVELRIW